MSDVSKDKNIIDRFRDRAVEFNRLYNTLSAQGSDVVNNYPAVAAEYNKLITSGDAIRDSISTVTGGIDSVVSWYNSLFGKDEGLKGFGLLPLVPIAVVATSVAAMGKWGRDVFLFQRRLTEIKRLEEQGMPPGRAADIVGGKAPGVFAGITREVMVPLTIGGVSLLALWMLMRNGKK